MEERHARLPRHLRQPARRGIELAQGLAGATQPEQKIGMKHGRESGAAAAAGNVARVRTELWR